MNDMQRAILRDPVFEKLVEERRRFSWLLTIIVLIAYFSFTLAVAFAPQWLAAPISSGSSISRGMPAGLALIVLSFALTGWYVHRANTRFDPLTRELLERLTKAQR
jgi:uncharacterized membrane protein (DUF485 family)